MSRVPDSYRNIAILAHVDAGKTTVSERLLYFSDTIIEMGEVDEGLATMDYLEEEKKRGITIEAGIASYVWKNCKVTFVDTPGHVDFGVEVDFALRAVEGVVLVLSGVNGIESQSLQAWEKIQQNRNISLGLINKLDVAGADYQRVLQQVTTTFAVQPFLMTIPIYADNQLDGVVDVLNQLALYRSMENPRKLVKGEIPEFLSETYLQARKTLLDIASQHSDTVMELYLSGDEIPSSELLAGLQRATLSRQYLPIYCGAALKNVGMRQLMNGINAFLPQPIVTPELEKHMGVVVKIRFYQDMGKIYLVKAFQEWVVNDLEIECIYQVMAESLRETEKALKGSIVAIRSKLPYLIGDFIRQQGVSHRNLTKQYEPLLQARLELKNAEDYDRVNRLLLELAESDPSISVKADSETGAWILFSVGELQLDVFCRRLKTDHQCDLSIGQPRVKYEERLKHHINGITNRLVWNNTEVEIELNFGALQNDRGGEKKAEKENILTTEILDKESETFFALDSAFQQFCQQGVCGYGSIFGLECHLVKFSFSSDKPALPSIYKCFTDALSLHLICSEFELFEPIMRLEVICPEEFCGSVLADLASRNGMVRKLDSDGYNSIISLEIPLESTFGYTTLLRSLTKGRGVFVLTYEKHGQIKTRV